MKRNQYYRYLLAIVGLGLLIRLYPLVRVESPMYYQDPDSYYWLLMAKCPLNGIPPTLCENEWLANYPTHEAYGLAHVIHYLPWASTIINPVLGALGCAAVAYLARSCGGKRKVALLAAAAFAFSPAAVARTSILRLDSDGGILLLGALAAAEVARKRYIRAIVYMALYTMWWVGWSWFAVIFSLSAVITLLREKGSPTSVIISIIIVYLAYSIAGKGVLTLAMFISGNPALIDELRPPTLADVFDRPVGSIMGMLLGLYGLSKIKDGSGADLMVIWVAASLGTSLSGVRFLVLATIPFSVLFGFGAYNVITGRARAHLWYILFWAHVFYLAFMLIVWTPDVHYNIIDYHAARLAASKLQHNGIIVTWWPTGAFTAWATGKQVLTSAVSQGDEQTKAVARALCATERGDFAKAKGELKPYTKEKDVIIYLDRESIRTKESWRTIGNCTTS